MIWLSWLRRRSAKSIYTGSNPVITSMKKIKYSKSFERDYNWYFKFRDVFTFDGTMEYTDKDNNTIFVEDENGLSAKECFYKYDSTGKVYPCREVELYKQIHKCKGSINFNIKMWAEDRGKGWLGKMEFDEEFVPQYELLDWMIEAVENQRIQHWVTR